MAKQYLGTKLQDLGEVSSLDPNDKIVIVKPKDEGVMELKEFFYYVQTNLDLSNYYTTVQANALFVNKKDAYTKVEADAKFAFIDRTYTKVQTDAKYALLADTYTKTETAAIYAPIDRTYLKTELYTKDETFATFALRTDILPPVDLSPYSTTASGDVRWAMKNEVYSKIIADARFSGIDTVYTKEASDIRFAKALTTYTKAETDDKFMTNAGGYSRTYINNNIYLKSETYTRLEQDTKFALKSNVYTIAAVNEQFAPRSLIYSRGESDTRFAPAPTTYSKIETNSLVTGQVTALSDNLVLNYHDKKASDDRYAYKADAYVKSVSDGKYALISDTLTTTQLTGKYYDKTQVDAIVNAIDFTPYLKSSTAASTYALLSNTYTKTVMEEQYYTKVQVDDALAAVEQGVTGDSDERFITYIAAENKYATKVSVYTKVISDEKYATLAATWSRLESDARYFLKAEVTDAIEQSATATATSVARDYLAKADAIATYITSANAYNVFYEKKDVYTKTETDAKYPLKTASYIKSAADARFYKLNESVLNLNTTEDTGFGSKLNFKNTSTVNKNVGGITWSNHEFELGHVKIVNTTLNSAEFDVYLRSNYITTPSSALKITHDYMEHSTYGRLNAYFAKASESYTRNVVDDLLGTIRNEHLTITNARTTYQSITGHNLLDARVTALDAKVTGDKTYVDTTFAKQTDVYTKTQGDSRYLIKDTGIVNLVGDTVDLNLKRNHATSSGYINFHTSAGRIVNLNATAFNYRVSFTDSEGVTTNSYTVSPTGIWQITYGHLHEYFAKAMDTYDKTTVDNLLANNVGQAYTRVQADAKFSTIAANTVLSAKVDTAIETVNSDIQGYLANHYNKDLTYSKVQADGRYHSKLDNNLTLNVQSGNTNPLNVVFNNASNITKLGGLAWMRGNDKTLLVVESVIPSQPVLKFGTAVGLNLTSILDVSDLSIKHKAYGELHEYFARVSDIYNQSQIDAKFDNALSQVYTRGVMDTKLSDLSNLKYDKSLTYSKVEADAKYVPLSIVGGADAKELAAFTRPENRITIMPSQILSDGWFTIAYGVSRAYAHFIISESASSKHVILDFTVAINYGRAPSIVVNNYSSYGNVIDTISAIEIAYGATYDGYIIRIKSGGVININQIKMFDNSAANLVTLLPRAIPKGVDTGTKATEKAAVPGVVYEGITNSELLSLTEPRGFHVSHAITSNFSIYAGDDVTSLSMKPTHLDYTAGGSSVSRIGSTIGSTNSIFFQTQIDGVRKTTFQVYGNRLHHPEGYGWLDEYFAKSTDVYTKALSDGRYHQKSVTYTRTEADARYELKNVAYNKATSDVRYEYVGVAYTKAEGDAKYELKNVAYTKATSDGRYELKDVAYTKAQTDALIAAENTATTALFNDRYTKSQGDARYEYKNVAYTKALSDGRYPLKTDVYTKSETYSQAQTHSTAQADARFAYKADSYTKTESDGRYHQKGVTYTRTESDARYVNYTDQLVKFTGSQTSTYNLGIELNNTHTTSDAGSSIVWNNRAVRSAMLYTTGGSVTQSRLNLYLREANAAWSSAFWIESTRIWHKGYGYLDDYFAKSSDTYGKGDVYTKTQGDARYAYKADSYTKAESDTNYHKKTVTYTRTEMDARYPLKAASYTKAEGDARYAKVWSGTQAQYNAITTKDAKTIYMIT